MGHTYGKCGGGESKDMSGPGVGTWGSFLMDGKQQRGYSRRAPKSRLSIDFRAEEAGRSSSRFSAPRDAALSEERPPIRGAGERRFVLLQDRDDLLEVSFRQRAPDEINAGGQTLA